MNKEILLFGKNDCGLCQGWKKKLEHFSIPFKYIDIDKPENLAEFTYHGFANIPALIVGEKKFEAVRPSDITIENIQSMLKEK
ncbi:MAG: glutaredoxin family protein [Candidatus Omnitrophica bacterium]|nr:glutaredoxin family protein [Candidatus Omnitrophota bacterium]